MAANISIDPLASLPPAALVDSATLGAHYGVSGSTIYRRRCYKPDTLPKAIKLGNRVRWRVADVIDFDERQASTPDATENAEYKKAGKGNHEGVAA